MVNPTDKKLSTVCQCSLLNISRSGFDYERHGVSNRNLEIMKAIDRIHTQYPFYGFRRIRNELRKYHIFAGKKLVIILMKMMAVNVIYPKQNTSLPGIGNRIYPCLLRGLKVERNTHVWAMDITYIAMSSGFMYLAVIMDVHSRFVVHRDISNTTDACRCKDSVASAISLHGAQEISTPIRAASLQAVFLPLICLITG